MIHSENVNKLLSQVRTIDDGYRALAMAVIVQAADDYRVAKILGDEYKMSSVEHFFRSWLFDVFARGRVNGEYILRKLREEDPKNLKRMYSTYHLSKGGKK